MARRCVDRLRVTRRRAITATVIWSAKMRAALQYLSRNANFGLRRVVAVGLRSAERVRRSAARFGCIAGVARRIPVGRPLPDIADHVIEAIAVRRERGDRRGPLVAVGGEVLVRKIALPGIRQMPAAGGKFVTPSELGGGVQAASRGKFPFRFGR